MSENAYFWFEVISMVVITGILLADLLIVFKRPHIPSTKESTLWVSFYAALAVIFGLLGTTVGAGFLRYSFKATLTKLEWWIEHLGAMIGSGIACYTAFFAFGGSRLFIDHGNLRLLSWTLPGVVGFVVIRYLSGKYQRRFAD